MKNSCLFLLLLLSTVAVTGCELIGDIFQAGVWVGALLVIAVIGIVVWLVSKSRG
jgi:uncharacterized membrane protein YkvI